MLDFSDWECNFDKSRKCTNGLMCSGCEFQPDPDDKVNGRKPPVKMGYSWEGNHLTGKMEPVPQCPSCGNWPYSNERCVFCGQKFLIHGDESGGT